MLETGIKAPDFSLPDENGVIHTAKIEGINESGELLVMEEFAQKRLCSGDITIESIESMKNTECMME